MKKAIRRGTAAGAVLVALGAALVDAKLRRTGGDPAHYRVAHSIAAGDRPERIAAADLDGDGRIEIVAASRFSDEVLVFESDTSGALSPERTIRLAGALGPEGVAIYPASKSGPAFSVSYWKSDRVVCFDSAYAPVRSIPSGDGPIDLVVGDFDGDERADLAVLSMYDGRVRIERADLPALERSLGVRPYRMLVRSVPGGPDRLLILETGENRLREFRIENEALVEARRIRTPRVPIRFAPAPGGGWILASAAARGSFRVGETTPPILLDRIDWPTDVAAGDFHEDRAGPEIAVADYLRSEIRILDPASGRLLERIPVPSGPVALLAIDLTTAPGDEIVAACAVADRIVVLARGEVAAKPPDERPGAGAWRFLIAAKDALRSRLEILRTTRSGRSHVFEPI